MMCFPSFHVPIFIKLYYPSPTYAWLVPINKFVKIQLVVLKSRVPDRVEPGFRGTLCLAGIAVDRLAFRDVVTGLEVRARLPS